MVNTAELQVLQSILGLCPPTTALGQLEDTVFVCLDCEAFELDQDKITEIGVAVLDTTNIRNTPAGEDGVDWLSHIKCAHYRIEEYAQLINKRYVKGDPGGFAFGQSTFISRDIASHILTQVFHDPSELSGMIRSSLPEEARRTILVGHGLRGDNIYLKKIGFSVNENENVVTRMDTQALSGSKKQQVSLRRLLRALDIVPTSSLHNAGNDAAYTLQALIRMAVREHTEPGKLAVKLAQLREDELRERAAWRAERKATKVARAAVRTDRDATLNNVEHAT